MEKKRKKEETDKENEKKEENDEEEVQTDADSKIMDDKDNDDILKDIEADAEAKKESRGAHAPEDFLNFPLCRKETMKIDETHTRFGGKESAVLLLRYIVEKLLKMLHRYTFNYVSMYLGSLDKNNPKVK
ncbi:hypothetical protein L2E82_26985 [Cichorium intybus]|uniref:Uncharacterized protein n=1 Tax=Cichorium intybus TaxID=13427 RepID=A0ACB9CS36_CICIN|nr:hypothetical protein L2E82_26985 [Cichorium intybus]